MVITSLQELEQRVKELERRVAQLERDKAAQRDSLWRD